jgi:hypothetical protein
MNYTDSKWYKRLYQILNIFEKILFFCTGIILPLQLAWSMRAEPFSTYLTKTDIDQISSVIGFTNQKTISYLDNMMISLAALFVILIFKITVNMEKNITTFKIIKQIAICTALIIICLMFINSN